MVKITVKGVEINIIRLEGKDFISLTDMVKAKDGDFFLSNWLRNRNTIEYLGIWETIYNANFNYVEFDIIKSKAGLNSYRLSAKEWIKSTNAIGLKSETGRYGGTYAHADIAFEFGMWISAEFKLYLIKEFQRLKDEEANRNNLTWNLQRTISKINYKIHTDAIKENLIPTEITKVKASIIYANEADLLNVALFGLTAGEWKSKHVGVEGNIRDQATLEQLVVLSNMESVNSLFITQKLASADRLIQLNKMAISQMKSLLELNLIKKLNELEPSKLIINDLI